MWYIGVIGTIVFCFVTFVIELITTRSILVVSSIKQAHATSFLKHNFYIFGGYRTQFFFALNELRIPAEASPRQKSVIKGGQRRVKSVHKSVIFLKLHSYTLFPANKEFKLLYTLNGGIRVEASARVL